MQVLMHQHSLMLAAVLNGCDSLVTLNLTINNSTNGTDVQTACDTYTWIDGLTYNASTNAPTFLLTNAAGCDSLVTLNLTINNSTRMEPMFKQHVIPTLGLMA
jgi:hypothetical protein